MNGGRGKHEGDKDAGRAHDAEWRRHGGRELGTGFRGEFTRKALE